MGILRKWWRKFTTADRWLHGQLVARFPQLIPDIDRSLVWLVDQFISHPAFAVILAPVLLVLAVAGVRTVVAISILVAWAISFVWIARAEKIRGLTIIARSLVLILAGVVLAGLGSRFGVWAVRQHDQSEQLSSQTQASKQQPEKKAAPTPREPQPQQRQTPPGPQAALPIVSPTSASSSRSEPLQTSQAKHPATVRSYAIFDGNPIFMGSETPNRPGGNFRPGDEVAFNIYYRATGPNPVDSLGLGAAAYFASDNKLETERVILEKFKNEVLVGENNAKLNPVTMQPGDSMFSTAWAWRDHNQKLTATAEQLNDLISGKEIIYVLSEILYRDNGVLHHVRRCEWLNPPALSPGVWHVCSVFEISD